MSELEVLGGGKQRGVYTVYYVPITAKNKRYRCWKRGAMGARAPPPDFMERGHRGAQGSTGGVYIPYTERQIIIRTRMRTDGVNSKCYIAIMGMVTQILVARFTCCYECPPQYKTSSVTYDM